MKNILNFKPFFKFLSRNKAYSAVTVFGLSVSIMFAVLVGINTVTELSFDNFHYNKERIYVFENEMSHQFPHKIKEYIIDKYPEIEDITGIRTSGGIITLKDEKIRTDMTFTDTSFFNIFSYELIEGDVENLKKRKNNIIISESFAKKNRF